MTGNNPVTLKRLQPSLLCILGLAFALRVAGLGDRSIWWDEGIGVWLARMPLLEAIRWTGGDVHPPLHYILQRFWWLAAGEGMFNVGAFVMRYLSVLISLLMVPLMYRLGKALGGERVGVLAALFIALSRFAIAWAQEIRMYALAATLATGALWAAVWLWRRGGWRPWLTYVATTFGCLFSLYLTVTVPLVANCGFLVAWWRAGRPRDLLRRWMSAQLAVSLLFAPWVAYALPRMHGWSSEADFSPTFFVQLYTTMLAVGSPLHLEASLPWVVGAFAALLVGLVTLWPRRRSPAQTGGLAMLLTGLIFPAVVVYVVSLPLLRFYFSRPLVPRYLLPLAGCFYVLLAWGCDALLRENRWRGYVAVALAVLPALIGLRAFYPGRAAADDYLTITRVLEAHRQPQDAVLLYVDRDWPIFVAHYPGARQDVGYTVPLEAAAVESLLTPLWAEAEGVWVVTTPEALRTDPQQLLPRWLAERAVAQRLWVDGENALTFYARTAAREATLSALAPGFDALRNVKAALGAHTLLGVDIPLPRYRTGDTLHLALYWAAPAPPSVAVTLDGPTTLTHSDSPPATAGSTRQQLDLPLTPDLPGGRYAVSVAVPGAASVHVGHVTLVRQAAGSALNLADIAHPLDYRLGEHVRLVGYDLPKREVAPGGILELTLYWQTDAPLDARYKVFAQLLGEVYNADQDNFLWGQQDNEPGGGQSLTTLWTPGAIIADGYRLPVAANAPPGHYTLLVGMYGLVDGARLPIEGPGGDAIPLVQVEVK